MSWRAVVIAAVLGAFGNSIVLAQSGTSAIAGLVSDESGTRFRGCWSGWSTRPPAWQSMR